MKTTLILDANQRSALSVTRSLGHREVAIYTADSTPTSLSGSSRYSAIYFQYPSPAEYPEAFIIFIKEIIISHHIEIIIPMTELTAILLLHNYKSLPDVAIPFSNIEKVSLLSDKCQLMKIAERENVPFPATRYIYNTHNIDESQHVLYESNYPLILKPGKSWVNDNQTWHRTSVKIAQNFDQASAIVKDNRDFKHHPYMIQEYIPGSGHGIFAIYSHGKAIAFFSHRRIREKPPWGGVSVLSESTQLDPTLLNYARKLLDSVKWHGVAMVEFKLNLDGHPYLMEINTRFWGSLQLAIDSGIDFPWLLYKIACDEHVEAVYKYKTGIRLRWLLGDIDSLYLNLKRKDITYMQKLVCLISFLRPTGFKTRYEVNRLNDIRPFWWEIAQYIKNIFH